MTSPLRYPGGKTRARAVLDDILRAHFDLAAIDTVVSPFFGGGSFEFFLQARYGWKILANDKFEPLYHFWLQAKTDAPALCDALRGHLHRVTKDIFVHHRNTIMDLSAQPLQQAIQYFLLNRCSFSGATLSGGFSAESSEKRFTSSSIDRLAQLNLTRVDVYGLDFEVFLGQVSGGGSESQLWFVDPPYYLEERSKLYGNRGDLHEHFDHERLYRVLTESRHPWMVTYNDCAWIRERYRDHRILPVQWSYGMNASKASSEVVILRGPG